MEIEITGIAPGGVGLCESDEGRLHVRNALPGDRVEVGRRRRERGKLWVDVLKVIDHKIDRRDPVCSHFGTCGGCDWMDLPYTEQLKLKQSMVETAFRDQRLEVEVGEILGSPEEFRYRNRVEFAFGNGQADPVIGFYEKGNPRDRSHELPPVCEVKECWIADEETNEVKRAVQESLKGSRLRAYNPVSRAGVLRSLEVRSSDGVAAARLSVANDKHVPIEKLASALQESDRKVTDLSVDVGRSRSKHAPPKRSNQVFGEGGSVLEVLGNKISFSSSVFSQVNACQLGNLYQIAMKMADIGSGSHVLDLYCGVGTLSIALAEQAESVTGIELDERAIADARSNADLNKRDNCRFACGDAADISLWQIPGESLDLIMVNPPRAGLSPEVIEGIAAARTSQVVYVSCNPETLARDCHRLCANNYRVVEVKPVDMFPQTAHVEAVLKLERRAKA